ncbi:MAG: ATP-binding cassette domain-containing protein [Lachnospiraceae bacterium]|nr:ATP-binding cassette domain-containing protein [Lachnospiraceae bacterium]
MLELKNIKKDYLAGENTVYALKGINLKFRASEFVSILGPSGCGKTTLLNIIGGLDQYTKGDLIINGKSTKDFKDRDWDTYRNHSIGFVFQSYNLIPHQSVLQNVELALTISGVSKSERRERAKKALEEVGLGSQLAKRPSEMSGGQMQRVAIARALVNNPDIILADEPTGALDTETSVQVMELLKKISKDRLIVMVTHNPELAEKYSSRIIRMLDGTIRDDSAPLSEEEISAEKLKDQEALEASKKGKKKKKPSMSFFTAFSLSLKNLFTKKGRTTLTAFAGSIGIIGISLVLAISQGLSGYIDMIQENALSSYPLSIQAQSQDLSSLMETFMSISKDECTHETDAVYQKSAIYDIVNALNNVEVTENDLKSFKSFLDKECAKKKEEKTLAAAINGIHYSYDLDLQIYTKNVDGNIIKSDTMELMQNLLSNYMGTDMSAMTNMSGSSMMGGSSMGGMASSLWQELLSGDNGSKINDLLKNQYEVVYGAWPNSYDEIVLVLDKNNELDDLTLYALGLESEDDMNALMDAAYNGGELETKSNQWSYEEICDMEFRTVLNSDCFSYDEHTGLYNDLRETDAGLQYLYDNGLTLKVSGIIKPMEDSETTMLTGSIGYTKDLTEYVVENSNKSDVIDAQLKDAHTDILTGLPFKENTGDLTEEKKQTALLEYIDGLDETKKAALYIDICSVPDEDELNSNAAQTMAAMSREEMETNVSQALIQQMGMGEDDVNSYIASMSDDEIKEIFTNMLLEQMKLQYAQQVKQQLSAMSTAELSGALDAAKGGYTTKQCAVYYDNVMEFSQNTYDGNLQEMGYVDLDDPSAINIYASSFENKEVIEDSIAEYNKGVEENSEIKYTDYVGIMMSSVSSIINAITYILIAFVAISLIVSSIMIGVITLISVQERTKEIGILRAIGASKHDVSSMFNAETVIIGFCAGLLGVLVTYALCIPINSVIHSVTGINSLNAVLPIPAAVILVLISVILTLISGLIPSKSAAKKDPVVALRTE